MGSWRELLFLYLIILNILTLTVSQPDFLSYDSISESGNYSTNSTYQTNLETLLSSLSSSTDRYGFYSSSFGKNPDKVYAIVLCRGDVDLDTCRSCINDATMKLPQLLPNYKAAIGWYDYCLLRYSNKSMNGLYFSDGYPNPNFITWNPDNSTSMNEFNQALRSLLDGLCSQASSGGAHRKFATGDRGAPDYQTIYGLMQCTPDLSQMDCNNCLLWVAQQTWVYFDGKIGGQVLTPTCTLQYETYQFFTVIPADAPPTTSGKKDNTTRTIIISVVLTIILVIGLIVCIWIFLRKKKQKKKPKHQVEVFEDGDQISIIESLQYDFETISVATDNFSDNNKLGQGGFGAVYKAWKTWRKGTTSNLIDPSLRANSGSMREMIRCIHIGLLCVQENVAERPTMASVVLMLSYSSPSIPVPSEPAFFLHSGSTNSELPLLQEHSSELALLGHSINKVSITELYPR